MSNNQQQGSGLYTYRSLLNDPDLSLEFNKLKFGAGNLQINISADGILTGRIYDTGWALELTGSAQYGNPGTLWFQGSGVVDGAPWVYEYLCYLVPHIPNGIKQIPTLVGSVIRVIPHPDGNGGISPAGVVCSFYAVLQTVK
ncbi:hypothetical protein IDJ75_14665 [Mucilaginibacter rigui]|uniref:Uncharacterized protein n=1 Tax=Mucilaginibacter rigui TaxID=534635 RepID=A0ABR7X7F6_9SPHI|nr:hypothetical protein [Mucilaginibacter rigui]MBD1386526.1 hypothetical protein [Mucilaginibacter rigui]